jgi:chromosome transmission fidelity protein 4
MSLVYKYSYTKKAKLCSLAWNPTNQNEIIFCDINGNMGLVKPTFKENTNDTDSKLTKATTNRQIKKDVIKESSGENLPMEDLLTLLGDENSNESTNSETSKPKLKISKNNSKQKEKTESKNEKLKSPLKKRKRLSDSQNETEANCLEEELDIDIDSTNDDNKAIKDDNYNDDDEDDMESLEKLKERTLKSVKKDLMTFENDGQQMDADECDQEYLQSDEKKSQLENNKHKQSIVSQPAFQPSSTSVLLAERYMVWNSIGLITQFMKEDDESIDIEFHNASYHHTIHLKNQYGYTMADMSKEAIVMASPGKLLEDELSTENYNSTIGSTLTNYSRMACIVINSCDNNKEWTIEMPRKEYIKCVCVSRMLVACMTSKRFLRIYGIAGTQKEIICFNGVPIAMSAYENCLFICYSTNSLSAVINYSLYYIDDEQNRDVEHGVLPLSENAKLEWLGFSDEGNPYFYDSNGYLFSKCLTISKKNVWTPISDLRFGLNHKSDNYWLIGIAERNQTIKTILCKGAKYPQVLPRPTLSIVPIQIPFCELDTEKTKLEKDYWKHKYMSLSVRNYDFNSAHLDLDQEDIEEKLEKFESNSREVLMKLFMFACKNGREQRAFEIASIMDTIALQLAIKYATKTRALVLAQNLNVLAEKKATLEYEKEKYRMQEEERKNIFYNSHSNNFDNNKINSNSMTQNNYVDLEPESTIRETNEVIFEAETTQNEAMFTNSTIPATISTNLDESIMKSCITPSSIPLTATRLNPFHKAKTPLNDASKSIINELEEKINKQQLSASSKEKDTWKPTPTRKLTKNKISNNTPTSSINSFFSAK